VKRREFVGLLGLAPWLPAIGADAVQDLKPYREVRKVARYATAKRNLAFVSFDCPVCRQYFAPLLHWGRTLPKQWSMEVVPVITRDLGFVVAHRAWAAAGSVPGANLGNFAQALFATVQDQRMSLDNPATYRAALALAGIDAKAFGLAFKGQTESLDTVIEAMQAFQIDAVPALAIAGRFVITPDHTNGNREQFITLASAIQSGVMRGIL